MRYLILIAVFVSGCAIAPIFEPVFEPVFKPAPPPKLTPEIVARQFEAAAFDDGLGLADPVLMRWTEPVKFFFLSESWGHALPYSIDINRINKRIAEAAGTAVDVVLDFDQANLTVTLLPRRLFYQAIKRLRKKLPNAHQIAATNACFAALSQKQKDGTITAAAIVIATDISEDDRRHCIPEKFYQIMGLPGDSCVYRPSLVCSQDTVLELQPADELLLAVLYDNELKPGMTKDEALPLVLELIKKRWPEFIKDE
ncbi:MAG: DUF2927 domain-containing protein [Rhodospirillaceae bacterium]|jgi:hypothetical protein|nr:DUF2927 domain-containing protein [Rhodospirillaceae bacterium]MBT4486739.1 DUF2927 domain-containing protein [Rhodospirillaceae bacterium]MBT5195658.1 DUF2927 domain-containing protein [Rhodospirillaceae bacterium]MBT5896168.1 DUF2927 domain-containing protein [Rhodospirillaceae bacterium]MBT6426763.1 DUF2927 domain-containing protein [Rhodospirillaceae bacterium]